MLLMAARQRSELWRAEEETLIRRLDRALQHVEGLDDDAYAVVGRTRTAVVMLQVERTASALLLNRHPTWRIEANQLRADAEEMFSEDEDSTDDD